MAKDPTMLGVPHRHIKRAIIWYLVVLAVAAGVAWWLYGRNVGTGPVEKAAQLDIKEYSLGGTVTTVSADQNHLTMKTGWVQNGKFVYYDRTVNTTTTTQVLSVTKQGTVPVINNN